LRTLRVARRLVLVALWGLLAVAGRLALVVARRRLALVVPLRRLALVVALRRLALVVALRGLVVVRRRLVVVRLGERRRGGDQRGRGGAHRDGRGHQSL